MHIAQGAPGAIAWLPAIGSCGLLPIAGRALASKGTSITICRRNFPSPSNT